MKWNWACRRGDFLLLEDQVEHITCKEAPGIYSIHGRKERISCPHNVVRRCHIGLGAQKLLGIRLYRAFYNKNNTICIFITTMEAAVLWNKHNCLCCSKHPGAIVQMDIPAVEASATRPPSATYCSSQLSEAVVVQEPCAVRHHGPLLRKPADVDNVVRLPGMVGLDSARSCILDHHTRHVPSV